MGLKCLWALQIPADKNHINLLCPNDAIWRRRSVLNLVQVMDCCLGTPSHYLSQYWLVINGFWSIHIRTCSREIFMISNCKLSLKISNSKVSPHLAGVHETFTKLVSRVPKFILHSNLTKNEIVHCSCKNVWNFVQNTIVSQNDQTTSRKVRETIFC